MAAKTYSVGFDLGGTKLASALVDSEGQMIEYRSVKLYLTDPTESPKQQQKKVIQAMAESAEYFRSNHPKLFLARNFLGFGLASAGPLNVEKGELIYPHNYRGWKRVPICALLLEELKSRKFRGSVHFQNDAMAASLGEGWVGSAKGDQSFVVITVGTGVGSGLILNGRPAQSRGMGSEWGHLLADLSALKSPKDLHRHTIEGLASGTAILRRAKEMGFQGERTEEVVAAIRSGESKWQILFDDLARALATLSYNLSIGFNLDRILISGGLVREKDLFVPKMKQFYLELVNEMNPAFRAPIQVAKLKDKAGVWGAARLPFLLK